MAQSDQQKSIADQVFEVELMPHVNALSKFAYSMAQYADEAADLVQVTYMRAYRAIGDYQRGSNAKAWLFRILKNAFINEYRKKKKTPTKVDYEEVLKLQEDDASNVPVYLDLRQELFANLLDDELTIAINTLPVNFRLVLLLCDIEGFTYEEISRITDVPIGTVRSRLHRARTVLKERLRDYAVKKGISDRRQKKT